MKYLENRIAELAEGKKITYRGAEIGGVIDGYKYADVTDDFKKIIKAK